MLGALVTGLFVFAAAAGYGAAALRALRLLPERFIERWVWAAAAGQIIFALLVLALGTAGALSAPALWGVCLAGTALGVAARPWDALPGRPRGWVAWAMLATIALSAVYGLLRAATPPTNEDALSYHFAAPAIYLEQGAIRRLDGIARAWWPATAQMHWAACFALSGDRAAQVFNVLEMLWVGLALAGIGRRLFNAQAGLVAAAIFVSATGVNHIAATGTDMFFLAFFGAAALGALLDHLERNDVRSLALCGIALGGAAGTKLPGLLIATVLLLIAVTFSSRRATAVVVIGLVAAVVAAPWYARLTAYTGNPLWPYAADLFGPGPWSREAVDRFQAYQWSAGHPEKGFVYGVTLFRSNFLQAAVVLLAFFRGWTRRHVALGCAWLLGAVLWWSMSPQGRMGIPYHAWLAVLTGGAVAALPRFRCGLGAAALVLVLFHVHYKDFHRVVGGAKAWAGTFDRESFLRREKPLVFAYDWVNAHAPDEPVFLYNSNLIYLRRGPWIVGDLLMTPIPRRTDLRGELRATGARWILVDADQDPGFAARWGEPPVFESERGQVFRVKP
jgi:hypothetical protein